MKIGQDPFQCEGDSDNPSRNNHPYTDPVSCSKFYDFLYLIIQLMVAATLLQAVCVFLEILMMRIVSVTLAILDLDATWVNCLLLHVIVAKICTICIF